MGLLGNRLRRRGGRMTEYAEQDTHLKEGREGGEGKVSGNE